jgi:hypothetical protein
MSTPQPPAPLSRLVACAALAGALVLAGCGKEGQLDRPAPLFGAKAKAEYKAEQERAAAQARAQKRGDDSTPNPAPAPLDNGRDPALDPLRASPPPGAPPTPFDNTAPGGPLPDPYANPNAQPR